jgi:uncharacterized protein (DUF4415 family)
MNNNFDPLYSRYADMDFTDAKPVAAVPALAKLQAEAGSKTRISMQLDNSIVAVFKARAEMAGKSYQALMRGVLQQAAQTSVRARRSVSAA